MIFCRECYQLLAPKSPFALHPEWECEQCGRTALGYEPLDLNLVNYELRKPFIPPKS